MILLPELPEVETVCRTLTPRLVGHTVIDVTVNLARIVKYPDVSEFIALMKGREILCLGRRGKYLLLELSGHKTLVIHLRMTGRLIYANSDQAMAKHTHVIFHLDRGHELRFVDQRQFGSIYLVEQNDYSLIKCLVNIGPEPLSDDFTPEELATRLAKRNRNIKGVLLDQSVIAGIGNIYADEALFLAGIHPERTVAELSPEEVTALYQAIRRVLQKGIAHRGTTIRDYVDGEGKIGGFQNLLQVYGREGQQCINCGEIISRKRVAGRSSYFCPCCQRKPKE